VDFVGSVVNGTGPYTYEWDFDNNGSVDAKGVSLTSPSYTYSATKSPYTATLTVTDSVGCASTATFIGIVVNPNPTADIQPDNPAICYLFKTPLDANPNWGTPPYTFLWSTAPPGEDKDGATTETLVDVSPSVTTIYTVLVTDFNGCWILSSETVTVEICWLRSYDHDPASTSVQEHLFSISETAPGGVPDGGFIVAGRSTDSSGGNSDAWVMKVDVNGVIDWQNTYGGAEDDYAFSVYQTCDESDCTDGIDNNGIGGIDEYGFIVAGTTASWGMGLDDVWVFKLDAAGGLEWQKRYGGADEEDYARSIQQTSDGGYIVAGSTRSFPSGRWVDFWLLKLDDLGDITWQKTYGGTEYAYGESVQETSDGGFIVAGETDNFGAGFSDAWMIKLDVDGVIEWETTYGDANDNRALSIQETSDNGYVVAGYTDVSGAFDWDAWVFKLNNAGTTVEWERTYDSGGVGDHDIGYSVRQNADGSYIFGGYTKAYDVFDPVGDAADDWDAWLMKLDATGAIVWEKIYGDGGCADCEESDCTDGIDNNGIGGIDETNCTDGIDNDGDGWKDELKNDVIYSAREVSDGTFAAVGYTYSFDAGGDSDGMILKVSSSGGIPGDPTCMFIAGASATVDSRIPTIPPSSNAVVGDSPAVPAVTTAEPASTVVSIGTRCFTFPGEVAPPSSNEPFLFLATSDMSWEEGSKSGSDAFNLYRGDIAGLPTGDYGSCIQPDLLLNGTTDVAVPPSGEAWFYLVAGENLEGEGSLGSDSDGTQRVSGEACL
jgi:hypothetical protein